MTLRPASPCENVPVLTTEPGPSLPCWAIRGLGVCSGQVSKSRGWVCESDRPEVAGHEAGTLGLRVDQEVKPPVKNTGREWKRRARENRWVWIMQLEKLNGQVWEVEAWRILLEAVRLWLSLLQTLRSRQAVYTLCWMARFLLLPDIFLSLLTEKVWKRRVKMVNQKNNSGVGICNMAH